jgi:signal transduction histidine kinase/ligand-binding sensor domain-containing protein
MLKAKPIIQLLPLLLWLLMPGSGLQGQLHTIRIPFENLTTKDGLISNQVNCIAKDSMGFYWYGTSLGLNRHDGNRLETFRYSAKDPHSLPHDYVESLLVVNRFVIAGLTAKGEIFLYDYRDTGYNRIFRIQTRLNADTSFTARTIATDGKQVFALDSRGNILVVDVNTRTTHPYHLETSPAIEYPNVAVCLGKNLWIGAENGLFRLDTLTCLVYKIDLSFYSEDPAEDMSVRVIESIDERHFILGSHRSSRHPFKGLIKFDHINLADEPLCLYAMGKSLDAYPIDIVKKIDPSRLFIRVHNLTRMVYDIGTHVWDTLAIRPNHTKYLTTSSLNCVQADGGGRYKIGSNQGLFTYFPETHMFKEYYPQSGTFKARQWTGIYVDEIEALIVATPSGIKHYVPKTDEITSYVQFPCVEAHHKLDQQPSLIRLDSSRFLVLSSYLYSYDLCTRALQLLEPDTIPMADAHIQSNLFTYTLKAQMCYFVRDGRLFGFNMNTAELQPIHIRDISAHEIYFDASGLCFDTSGYLWVTTYNHGLLRIDLAQRKAFSAKPLERSCQLNDIWIDKDNTVWLASNGCGLIKANIAQPNAISYHYYDVEAGYITSDLNQIMEDDFGRIWSTSRYGINYFEKSTENIYNFSKPHGIEYPHNLFRGKAKDEHGNFYVSGGINILKITPSAFVQDATPPAVYIKQFQINNKPVTAFWSDTSITLRDRENNFAFDIAAINHIHPKLAKYKYKLEGFHKDWISTTPDQLFIPFNNLPHGRYTFHTIAANHQGKWNPSGISVQLRILPPLVGTFWFRAMVVALLLAVLNYIYKQRTQRLLAIQRIDIERKLALEAERSRISRDMHDDLGSGLSAIHLMSNYLKENTASKYPEFSEDIEKIRKSSEDLNQRIREIIWTVNSKDDTLQSLMSFIQRHAHEMSDNTKVPIHVRMPNILPDISLNGSQRKNLFLAVKEAIHNAIKHGHPNSIEVELMPMGAQNICFQVRDDGKGFDMEKMKSESGGNGLRNMNDRMADIGGTVDIQSSGAGTAVTFKLEL